MSQEEPQDLYSRILRLIKGNKDSEDRKSKRPVSIFQTDNRDGDRDGDPDEDTTRCECSDPGTQPPSVPSDSEMQRLSDLSDSLSSLSQNYNDLLNSFNNTFAPSSAQSQSDITIQQARPNRAPIDDAQARRNALADQRRALKECLCAKEELRKAILELRKEINQLRSQMLSIYSKAAPLMRRLGIPIVPPNGEVGSPSFEIYPTCMKLPGGGLTEEQLQQCQQYGLTPDQNPPPYDHNTYTNLFQYYQKWNQLWKTRNKKIEQMNKLIQRFNQINCLNESIGIFSLTTQSTLIDNSNEQGLLNELANDLSAATQSLIAAIKEYNAQVVAWNNAKNSAIQGLVAAADAYNAANNGLPSTPIVQQIYFLKDQEIVCENGNKILCPSWTPTTGQSSPTRGSSISPPTIPDLPTEPENIHDLPDLQCPI